MNYKQKVITVAALVVFLFIGMIRISYSPPVGRGIRIPDDPPPLVIPWIMVGVVYAALFFLLKDKRGS